MLTVAGRLDARDSPGCCVSLAHYFTCRGSREGYFAQPSMPISWEILCQKANFEKTYLPDRWLSSFSRRSPISLVAVITSLQLRLLGGQRIHCRDIEIEAINQPCEGSTPCAFYPVAGQSCSEAGFVNFESVNKRSTRDPGPFPIMGSCHVCILRYYDWCIMHAISTSP